MAQHAAVNGEPSAEIFNFEQWHGDGDRKMTNDLIADWRICNHEVEGHSFFFHERAAHYTNFKQSFPRMTNIYVTKNGEQLGPYDDRQLAEFLRAGKFTPEDFGWAEGMAAWQPLRTILMPAVPPPLPPPHVLRAAGGGDATGGVIPYKNPQALISYYLGVFSLIPVLGLLLTIPALILGVLGLKKQKAFPAIKGGVHAWVGISLASISLAYHIIPIALILVAHAHQAHR
ncbi:MAG TPA: DUF4339 domain-containing protein [Chthoniobacteraceae bacterium]|nr:DUF4339 domain-containing protein [Chthoniobacteraceae bacterium]